MIQFYLWRHVSVLRTCYQKNDSSQRVGASHLITTAIQSMSLLIATVLWAAGPLVNAQDQAKNEQAQAPKIKVALFDVDATPALGSPMAYDPVRRIDELTLRCRGMAILGSGDPIVLCAVDWIGIANEGHDYFRDVLANAAGTKRERVAVHALHQHDAPGCDFTAERLVKELQVDGYNRFEGDFHRKVAQNAAQALKAAIGNATPITHFGYGQAEVKEVASNRRVEVDENGNVGRMRGSSCRIQELIDMPEGIIDPIVSVIAFYNGEQPVAVVSSYACHPQSFYRVGVPSPDFPGIARFMRGQDLNNTLHIHFNGAGGNVAAGKYNNGAQPNRMILANRLAKGMKEAFESVEKQPLSPEHIGWNVVPVALPVGEHLVREELIAKLKSGNARGYISLADQLAFVDQMESGKKIDISCLAIGPIRMLNMPGELFVEYQLRAKALRPDLNVMMAAYGDYGPGYIGTAEAYAKGGYELAPTSTNVAPEADQILMGAVKELLEVK